MPPIVSSSKALARLLSGRNPALDVRNGLGLLCRSSRSLGKSERLAQTRSFSSIARIGNPSTESRADSGKEVGPSFGSLHCKSQSRCFLGAGDGEEGDVLSKTYEERRMMGYSPEQLFAVVAAVDLYEDFVPWCRRSKILRRNNDGSFDAELEIGFKFLVESYVSHVEMKKLNYIKKSGLLVGTVHEIHNGLLTIEETRLLIVQTTASESGLFDHLINVWEFNPGPVLGTCDLYFMVDFKFQSPLYRQVASMFFKEVVSRLVVSFSDRCSRIYGPGVQVLENAYGQGR